MSPGAAPWSDQAVDAGFAAAYEPFPHDLLVEDAEQVETPAGRADVPAARDVPQGEHLPTEQDELDEAADRAARPLTRDGRRARAPRPARLSPARAVAGALVSVAGVLLGIGTLLWVSDDPSQGPGPVVQQPAAQADSFASQPESEEVPVDPVDPPLAPAPAAEQVPSAAPAPAPAPAVEIPVLVLNNSRVAGLADRSAARYEAAGWPVRETGNFRGRIRATTVYYEPGQEAAARAFAERFPEVARVLPRFAGLPGTGLTVVLTRDAAS